MNLQHRIDLMVELGKYIKQNNSEWQEVIEKAYQHNGWFIPGFVKTACDNICDVYLEKEKLQNWCAHYHLDDNINPKTIGLVMAGNIPLVGFHDFLTIFISGHKQMIKLSSRDNILMDHLIKRLHNLKPETKNYFEVSVMLKGCDAYIATGSNNTSRYFEEYFSKYPNIIRKNRTSVAILSGKETARDLEALSDDVHLYFGLGCRNVTKIFVPQNYEFVPLLNSFHKYKFFADHHKYINNYDYQLSVMLMNNIFYMTNGTTLLAENPSVFSPISVLNYEFYTDIKKVIECIDIQNDIQCITGEGFIKFGHAQNPGLNDYADGVDTMQFLLTL